MKSYIVDRSSSTPQLNEMPTNVEKIYPSKADAEVALANGDIADGEFVSTVDTVNAATLDELIAKLNEWVDITADFTITEFNWNSSTTKILYNAALKKLKVKTTRTITSTIGSAHGVKITYNGSDTNITFGDNVVIYGSTNYSVNTDIGGYEPVISVISTSELQLYGHNRNTSAKWPANTALIFIVEM